MKSSKLTRTLEIDENGNQELNLIPIELTTIHIPTQEDYLQLMKVCERGGGDGKIKFYQQDVSITMKGDMRYSRARLFFW